VVLGAVSANNSFESQVIPPKLFVGVFSVAPEMCTENLRSGALPVPLQGEEREQQDHSALDADD
jgi:hypothetical protein